MKKVPITYQFQKHDWWRMPLIWIAAMFAMIAFGTGLNAAREWASTLS